MAQMSEASSATATSVASEAIGAGRNLGSRFDGFPKQRDPKEDYKIL